MYIPHHFAVTDQKEIVDFIESHAFGQLISVVEGRPFSTHLPFRLSEDNKRLVCHVARQNPQWQEIEGQEVLVSLQGPHAYVSPSWYEQPGVPTWNYQAVHIYGNCRLFHDPDELKQLVDALTQKYESTQENPWQPHYSPAMLKVIVGIEINIDEIQAKFKLSQNRSVEDRTRVIAELQKKGATEMAKAMNSTEKIQNGAS